MRHEGGLLARQEALCLGQGPLGGSVTLLMTKVHLRHRVRMYDNLPAVILSGCKKASATRVPTPL